MRQVIEIEFSTHSGSQTVKYNLADNLIAQQWFDKIKLLQDQNISIDHEFTSSIYGVSKSYEYYKEKLDNIVDWVNNTTNYSILHKDHYTQSDLCEMHDVYVTMANDPACDIYNETYSLNKYIHLCEHTLNGPCTLPNVTIAWGTNDGMTMQDFDTNPYEFYTTNIVPGNIYLYWVEIGKRPFEYWADKDPDNIEHFLSVACPHKTWSAHCKIALLTPPTQLSENYVRWFNKYKQAFLDKWNLKEWELLHDFGAIELATLQDSTTHSLLLEQFESVQSIRAEYNGA